MRISEPKMKRIMSRRHRRTPGQALVELALAITLIFFLLAATVDIGLIYFTLQAMRTASQEGAAFGSYPVSVLNPNGTLNRVDLNDSEIVRRVRYSGGQNSTGFADLQDLDGNGVRDETESVPAHNNPRDPNAWIFVELLGGNNPSNLTGTCPTSTPMQGMQNGGRDCWIRVTVRYNYRVQFPIAPVFGRNVRLQVRTVMPIRSTYFITR
jgi:hypothetical protein